MTIIPDHAAASRVGAAAVSAKRAMDFRVFTYQQVGSGLTLYGVALRLADGSEQEVRLQ